MNDEITIGDIAPSFTLPTSKGRDVSLKEFKGCYLIVFFYPKDSTPGCTTEAVEFSNRLDDFSKLNTKILGISKDSLKRHTNFIEKNTLTIELGSDASGDVCESFGVWKEKKNYGKTYMGIERSTFLIDTNGVILKVWRKVRVAGHVEAVLQEVSALNHDT